MIVFSSNIKSQSIINNFGGIETEYIIYSDTLDLEVEEQILIKRAVSNHKHYIQSESGYGYGYGYSAIHLEFISKHSITSVNQKGKWPYLTYFKITLYSNSDIPLYLVNVLHVSSQYIAIGQNTKYIYSIEVKNIPVLILEKAHKINIVKVIEIK